MAKKPKARRKKPKERHTVKRLLSALAVAEIVDDGHVEEIEALKKEIADLRVKRATEVQSRLRAGVAKRNAKDRIMLHHFVDRVNSSRLPDRAIVIAATRSEAGVTENFAMGMRDLRALALAIDRVVRRDADANADKATDGEATLSGVRAANAWRRVNMPPEHENCRCGTGEQADS